MDTSIELPEPWYWTEQDFADQLKKEVIKGHVLFGKTVKTLARRQDNDDVLFLVDNKKFAVVHLTWSGLSSHTGLPRTEVYETWDDLFNNRILVDKEGYEIGN